MAPLNTADLCDANVALLKSGDLRILQPVFKVYGRTKTFYGPVTTVKVFDGNVSVRPLLETRGEGRVLVIDGGGSMRCALFGGTLTQLAEEMGWAGVIVYGCVRDVDEINACNIGVRALASNPRKPGKTTGDEKHVTVHVAGTVIHEGEWLYADSDGILVSKTKLF